MIRYWWRRRRALAEARHVAEFLNDMADGLYERGHPGAAVTARSRARQHLDQAHAAWPKRRK